MSTKLESVLFTFADGSKVTFAGNRILVAVSGGESRAFENPWESVKAENVAVINGRQFKPRLTDARFALRSAIAGEKSIARQRFTR